MALSDAEAKRVLLDWPTRTSDLWRVPSSGQYWLRAQPKNTRQSTPRLQSPGALAFKTQPDGMWAFMAPKEGWADIVAVEVCGSKQNLNDKRARYAGLSRSMLLKCPRRWLRAEIPLVGKGSKKRWEACGTFEDEPASDLLLPVRFLTVLFALPGPLLTKWRASGMGAPGEYYCTHQALRTYNSQDFQTFLRQMSFSAHYR